jgi:Fur family ferric uptake transcriptional regulator
MPRGAEPTPPPEIIEPLCAVFRRKLRSVGLKYTPERAAVLDAAVRAEGLFEADKIIEDVKAGGIRVSKATVYRTLKLLQEAGVIQRVPLDTDQAFYQTVFGRRASDLILRLDTGQAIAVELPEVVDACREACVSRGLSFRAHQLVIYAAADN